MKSLLMVGSLAKTMGRDDVAELLLATLEEEEQTDAGQSAIAENDINWEAEQEGEGNED